MRWLLAAVPLAFAAQAQAQTTFNASDCSPYVAITNGGLTVTATVNPNNSNAVTCQANVGKYSGRWYYQAVPNTIGWTSAIGLAKLGYSVANPTTSNVGIEFQLGRLCIASGRELTAKFPRLS